MPQQLQGVVLMTDNFPLILKSTHLKNLGYIYIVNIFSFLIELHKSELKQSYYFIFKFCFFDRLIKLL